MTFLKFVFKQAAGMLRNFFCERLPWLWVWVVPRYNLYCEQCLLRACVWQRNGWCWRVVEQYPNYCGVRCTAHLQFNGRSFAQHLHQWLGTMLDVSSI